MQSRISIVVAALALFVAPVFAGDWTAFRGPAGNGISTETNLPVTWSKDQNIQWKVKLPAPGNSSPIVSGGRVFLALAQDEGRKRSLYCFDRTDGKELWVRTVNFDKVLPTHQTNQYAGSTPAADGQHVVVWHASAGLFCYDLDGNELWSRDLGEFRHMWGYGTSPVIYNDRVILHTGPGKRIFVAALDLSSGKTLWETDEPYQGDGDRNELGNYMGSWATPVIANVDGKDNIICSLPTRVVGYDPDTGEIVWWCEGLRGNKGDLAYSSPIICGDICVAVGGFGGPSIGFKLGGTGNITETNRLWRLPTNPQSIGTGVYIGGHVYRPNASRGTIDCIEPATGKIVWTNQPGGAQYWGSMILADGRLYATNQDGATTILKPNPIEYEEIAVNQLKEEGNSTPAFSNGQIFLRTFENLYCIGE